MLEIDLNRESSPLVVADEVGRFISDGLRNDSISLYAAFLLNQDLLSLRRMGYRQSAWQYHLSLSGVLALYMQYLFGLAIGEANVARAVAAWLEEDIPLLSEKREHYILGYLEQPSVIEPSQYHLIELSGIRARYETLSDDDGPYHTEVFPYNFFSPEDVLLGRSTGTFTKGKVDPDVEDIMLAISAWG